jgi:hypothetical protein
MAGRAVKINLGDDKGVLQIEATARGETEVSASRKTFSREELANVMQTIEGFAETLQQSLSKLKPQKATVEFGVEIGAESGQLTALIVKGTGSANLKVTLEWELGKRERL